MSFPISLNSACNCCETIPFLSFRHTIRSKGVTIGECGFIKEGDETNLYRQITTTYTETGSGIQLFVGIGSDAGADFYAEVNEGDTTQVTLRREPSEDGCGCERIEVSGFYWDDPAGVEVDNEYAEVATEAELIESTERCFENQEFFESYEDDRWFDYSFVSSENYIEGGTPAGSYTISESRLSLIHPPTVSGYLKIWLWQRKWTMVNGEYQSQELEPFDTYEWSGAPTFPDLGVNAVENRITSPEFEILAELGTVIDVFIGKWSLIPDYEPSDPILDPNAEINAEVSSWIRPSPDCFSNGTPTVNAICPASLFV
jgi:hypothetical protein